MRRRTFLALSWGALTVCSGSVRAQANVRKLAILHPALPLANFDSRFKVFFATLASQGFIEGQSLSVFRYSAEGQAARFAELARDAVLATPDAIFAVNTRMVRATRALTSSIPIVAQTSDPISNGLTDSLAKPSQNITGVVVDAGRNIIEKHLDLLREAAPTAQRVGVLTPAAIWEGVQGRLWREIGQRAGIALAPWTLGQTVSCSEYERVFRSAERVDALVVGDASENFSNAATIAELAKHHLVLTIYPGRIFAEAGGAISYGFDQVELYQRAAVMIADILRGAVVSSVPFYQARKFELVLNMRALKDVLPSVPTALLVRADEVIE